MKNNDATPLRVRRAFLHKTYLQLLESTFKFIKKYYIKDREIPAKRDPEIYGSLVYECSLSELRKKKNLLQKLFLKLQQNEFYEDYFFSREILQLLFLPCFSKMEYYILLQHHILENGAVLQIDLQNYFNYVEKEFQNYLLCVSEIYNLPYLLDKRYLNYNMRFVNCKTRNFTKKRPIKAKYQIIQGLKHQSLAIQMMLLREISKAETKNKIKKLSYDLTSFICRPDELFCSYV
uniref:Uncharacterized protein n=1 Tax=Eunotia naegelii TaxID=1458866 RepID=A0A2U9GIT1_9STRA|nr:hypothetical protein [Eunotia naegelii]AWQ64085.1 hypothetical protein [Eunotia naegelii]